MGACVVIRFTPSAATPPESGVGCGVAELCHTPEAGAYSLEPPRVILVTATTGSCIVQLRLLPRMNALWAPVRA